MLFAIFAVVQMLIFMFFQIYLYLDSIALKFLLLIAIASAYPTHADRILTGSENARKLCFLFPIYK